MPEDMGAVGVAEPVEAAGEVVETETGAEGEVASEASNQVDSPVEKQGLTQKFTGKSHEKLADVVKKSGEALKAIDPSLPAAIRTAAFEQASLYREFPGGLKEATGLKRTISEYGGVDGIKENAETVSEFGALAQAFFDGKPDFVDNLIEESAPAFSQMMPDGMAKWKQVDGDAYTHHVARAMMDTLRPLGVAETLAELYNALDPKEAAPYRAKLETLYNAFMGIREKAEKVPEKKVDPRAEQLTQREQQIAEREQRAMMAPIANEGRQQIESITAREMTQSYQWDKTDPSVKEAVSERVRNEVISASKKDTGFCAELDRLRARGDAAGLARHVKSFQDRVTPAIVQRVARLFNVKPKGAATITAKKPVAGTNGTVKASDQGWTRWTEGTPPRANLVDRSKTTDDMILSNPAKYVLKDGRKVLWG